jgi:hypothetical protein
MYVHSRKLPFYFFWPIQRALIFGTITFIFTGQRQTYDWLALKYQILIKSIHSFNQSGAHVYIYTIYTHIQHSRNHFFVFRGVKKPPIKILRLIFSWSHYSIIYTTYTYQEVLGRTNCLLSMGLHGLSQGQLCLLFYNMDHTENHASKNSSLPQECVYLSVAMTG